MPKPVTLPSIRSENEESPSAWRAGREEEKGSRKKEEERDGKSSGSVWKVPAAAGETGSFVNTLKGEQEEEGLREKSEQMKSTDESAASRFSSEAKNDSLLVEKNTNSNGNLFFTLYFILFLLLNLPADRWRECSKFYGYWELGRNVNE